MRRLRIIAVAVCATLVVTAVALAAQTNTYTVTGSITPSKAGTTKKPIPVAVNFDYTVGEASNQRPALINQYYIKFDGVRVNGARFAKCTAASINNTGDDSKCPAKALVGTGNVENQAGPTDDPSKHDLKCHLNLKVYNGGASKGALFLKGGPPTCPINISQAIDANYIASSTGTTLRFAVQGTLLHPLPGIDNAVVQVNSKIKRVTTKYKGKTVGYYQTTGGCKAKRRYITVTFKTTAGQTSKAQKKLVCSTS